MIRATDPADPQVAELLAASDAYMAALYPPASNHLDGVAVLATPNVYFLGAWAGDRLLACGAVKSLHDEGPPAADYGEIKRVFVRPEHRGQGLAVALMGALHDHLLRTGVRLARLETGIHQPEALQLYRRLGYRERGPFGHYAPDPLSVFMEIDLASRSGAAATE